MTELELRERFSADYKENISKGLYEEADLKQLASDERFLDAYLKHNKEDVVQASKFLHTSLEWRKSFGVKDLSSSSFPVSLMTSNTIFFCNKDKDGHRILHVQVVKMKKDTTYSTNAKKYLVWQLEKAFQANMGQRIVVLLDMTGTGLYNVDTNIVKFLISCFTTYFPYMLEYLLVVELPWILNALWQVIKTWLTAEQQKFVLVVKKNQLQKYINRDQLFIHLGGNSEMPSTPSRNSEEFTDSGEASIEDSWGEVIPMSSVSSSPLAEVRHRTVKTLESLPTPMPQTTATDTQRPISLDDSSSTLPFTVTEDQPKQTVSSVSLFPAEFIKFVQNGSGYDAVTSLTITNKSNCHAAYKIKTTSPDIFKVRPILGTIGPQSSTKVSLTLLSGKQCNIGKDKFLVMIMMIRDEAAIKEDRAVTELWKTMPKNSDDFAEHRLPCRVENASINLSSGRASPNGDIQELHVTNEEIMVQLKLMTNYLIVTTLLMSVIFFKLFLFY